MDTRLSRTLVGIIAIPVLAVVAASAVSSRYAASCAEPRRQKPQQMENSRRVKELALERSVQPAEALAVLRKEAETRGPQLYEKHCAECHRHADRNGKVYGAEASKASDLTGLGSPEWIAGWFDKKKIVGPAYFGNTAFKDGDMVDFVRGSLGEVLEELAEEDDAYKTALDDLVACLAAEAKLDEPRKADADEETIEGIEEDSQFLFEDLTCTECHRFYHLGDLGDGPDLTGYMSRQWLTDIIKNPAHERFYGSKNDEMPAHHESPDNCLMTAQDIDTLVDWLRGTWDPK